MKKIIPFVFFALLAASFLQAQPVKVARGERIPVIADKLKNFIAPYDFSNVHMCLTQHRNVNIPPRPNMQRINADGTTGTIQQGLSSVTNEMWSPGDVITVGFYSNETTPFVISKVTQYAREWEKFANIKFSFIPNVGAAQIKVGFAPGLSWSWIGREVLGNTFGQRTMNFGWFTDTTKELEFSRVAIHEFGHALGFIHEHQAPNAGIQWDKDKVYAFLGGPPNNWDRKAVDDNVFYQYSVSSTNSSTYDRLSIMHYFFPAELTLDHSSFFNNTYFSPTDIQFSKFIYPFTPAPTASTGTLRTGDDCDEIDFKVEFNAVDKSIIEVILKPGIDKGGNMVSWWKQVGLPLKGGGTATVELNETRQIQIRLIDITRGISFAKAKIFGVHTGLGYTWNAFPAIIGGTRVTLTWRNDHCYN